VIYSSLWVPTGTDLEAPAKPPISAGNRLQWLLLVMCMAVYVFLFALYYPPLSAIEDEVGFVNQAIVWSKGSVFAESAGYPTMTDFIRVNGHTVAWRNPGRSLIILPFIAMGGVRAVFLTGALIHLAMTLVAAFLHRTLGQSPLWAILVLCHPTLGIYSRTVMGDAPAGLFVLAAVYVMLSRPRPGFPAGVLVGLGAVMRYHVLVILPFLAAALWLDASIKRSRLESMKFLAGGGLVAALLGIYNARLYGSVFGVTAQGYFSWRFLLPHLLFYSMALLLLWPGMFLAPLVDRSRISLFARATCVPIVLLFSFYYFHDRGSSWAEDLVLGQRLIQCVLPMWIVAYASAICSKIVPVLDGISPVLLLRTVGGTSIALLLLAQWYTFRKHQDHLQLLRSVRDEVVTTVPGGAPIVANYMVQKLFGISDPALPRYSWIRLDEAVEGPVDELLPSGQSWYCGVFPKGPDDRALKDLPEFLQRFRLKSIPTRTPGLLLYSATH
jgi:hypothetical protein